ncbi:MAG TPA: PKD domain-containing protein [Candidatus Deferrimicrobium sp.]|nr:PKD domain-containing protein [Candidatus Deferrimicrobium sp.]
MRCKKTLILIVALLVLLSSTTFAKNHQLKRVGIAPLMKCGVKAPDDFKALLVKYEKEIEKGFTDAGSASLYPDFMEQVKNGSIKIKEDVIPKGQQMQWMLFRAGKVVKNVDWAGKKPLDVHMLTIQKDCKDYHFIVPKPCGNIALVNETNAIPVCGISVSPEKVKVGETITVGLSGSKCATKMIVKVYHPAGTLVETKELTAGDTVWKTSFKGIGEYFFEAEAFNADGVVGQNECKAKTEIVNTPPECGLVVSPTATYTGKPVKMDASGSTDVDSKVAKADFTITKDGAVADQKSVTSEPLVWDKIFTKSGKYKVNLQVADEYGAVSTKTCESSLEVQKRLYYLAEAGPMLAKGTYSGYFFARVGLAYLIVPEKLSMLMSVGGALTLTGDPFKSHFLSNLLLLVHFNDFYVGGGIGYSSEVREPDWKAAFNIVGNIGYDVYKAFNMKGSIFGELRIPVIKGVPFSEAHAILVGFRLLF